MEQKRSFAGAFCFSIGRRWAGYLRLKTEDKRIDDGYNDLQDFKPYPNSEEPMQTQANVSVQPSNNSSRVAVLSFFEQRPVLSAVMIFIIDMIASILFGLTAKAVLPQYPAGLCRVDRLSVVIALFLSMLGWWKAAGFNFPTRMAQPPLMFVSVPYRVGVALSERHQNKRRRHFHLSRDRLCHDRIHGRRSHARHRIARAQAAGVNRRVVISSPAIWFNAYRQPALSKSLYRFCSNDRRIRPRDWFGAIRLRTNTIWFPVILHGLHDLALKYTNFPAIPLDVVQVTLLMIYGIYLLRTWRDPESTEGRSNDSL